MYFKIVVVETRKRGTGAHSRTRAARFADHLK